MGYECIGVGSSQPIICNTEWEHNPLGGLREALMGQSCNALVYGWVSGNPVAGIPIKQRGTKGFHFGVFDTIQPKVDSMGRGISYEVPQLVIANREMGHDEMFKMR